MGRQPGLSINLHPRLLLSLMKDYASLTDQQLAEAIKHGDAQAFHTLYHRYYQRLFTFVWYRCHSVEASRDLLQEAFARVWNSRESLKPEKSIKAYLYRIANNLMINKSNKQTVERAYLTSKIGEERVATISDNFDLKEKIQEAIDSLPDKARTVFLLHRYEHFTYQEIADALSVSVKTVEKRMSQALKIMREKLAPFR